LRYCSNLILGSKGDVIFQPLTAFSYADGQQMVTLTGILIAKKNIEKFLLDSGIKNWQLANTDWSPPKQINIPDFTLKERLCVDSLLPGASADDLHNALGFKFDNKEKVWAPRTKDSLKMI
jgi:hypothetical protein